MNELQMNWQYNIRVRGQGRDQKTGWLKPDSLSSAQPTPGIARGIQLDEQPKYWFGRRGPRTVSIPAATGDRCLASSRPPHAHQL